MYRTNDAPLECPKCPTWRERFDASLNRNFDRWCELVYVTLVGLLAFTGPGGAAPGALIYRVLWGLVAGGALAIGCLISVLLLSMALSFLVERLRGRRDALPEDTAFVVVCCVVTIAGFVMFCHTVKIYDARDVLPPTPLNLQVVGPCRVVDTDQGRLCLPADQRLVWCVPRRYKPPVPGRVYTASCTAR